MLLDGFADGAEDDALLTKFVLESGLHRHRIHNGIDGCVATQRKTFLEGNAQLVEGLLQLRINGPVAFSLFGHRVGIIGDRLIIDGGQCDMPPIGLSHGLPMTESLQAELKHPVGFTFLRGDQSDDILVQTPLDDLGLNIGGEAELVLLLGYATHQLFIGFLLRLVFMIVFGIFHK